jgi:hypothetical protein
MADIKVDAPKVVDVPKVATGIVISNAKRVRGQKQGIGDAGMTAAIANLCARSLALFGVVGDLKYRNVTIGAKGTGSKAGNRYSLIREGMTVREHARLVYEAAMAGSDGDFEFAYRQVATDLFADLKHDTSEGYYTLVRTSA